MNILHRLDDVAKLQRGEMVRPEFVDLHTSNICNMDCVGCAYRGTLSAEYMPEHRHFEAVGQFLRAGVKAFDFAGGGEPTTLPYLPRLMRHIGYSGAHFALITNGLLFDDELIEVLVEAGTYCRISLEASNPDDYCRYKRVKRHVWDKVIENINRLVAERNARKSELEISLKFAVGKSLRGYQHYRDIKEMLVGLGVERATVKALTHEPEELSNDEKFLEHCLVRDALGEVSGVHFWIMPDPDVPQCYLNPLHTVMDWKGDIWICCYGYVHGASHRIGNIFDTPFTELWGSEEHRRKIAAIDRSKCAQVFCKFFKHHAVAEKALKRGAGYWL